MKILLTGGAGFIWSAVVRLAIERGHSVVNLDCLSYTGGLTSLGDISDHPSYSFEKIDIRNRSKLPSIFATYRPDAVMHLAAESHVDRSIADPTVFIETNIHGTFNMLEAARYYFNSEYCPKTFKFHHVSTDEVFGSLPDNPDSLFREDTPL